jgi:DNA-binding SARP family transcriptional activator
MLREKRLRLLTLGQLALVDHMGRSDDSLTTRPRKLALLAVLALAPRPLTRDSLVGMFWGEQEEVRARHSLSDALSHLRRALGARAIIAKGVNVSLDREAPLDLDVLELADAFNAGDHPRVTQLYRGRFFESVFVGGSEIFDRWAERERQRLEALFTRSAAAHCEILARTERWDACASLAIRWLDVAPTSADAALYMLTALSAPGTRESALRALAEYDRLKRRLAEDYVLAPERKVIDLAERLHEQAHQTMEVRFRTGELRQLKDVGRSTIAPSPARYRRLHWMAIAAVAIALIGAALVMAIGLRTNP